VLRILGSMHTGSTAQRPLSLGPGGGEHYHFLNHLATVKVSGGTEGQLSVVEFLAPRGFGPPLHRHNDEDELFVVLRGEIVLRTDGIEERCEEGGVALLPRGVPHGFQVLSEDARVLNVTGSTAGSPRFDAMVAALGTPLDEPRLPAPVAIDPGEVAEVCADHGIDILGPPPPPLQ
jgi:quercetin dioxygenase-like cupin family protein